MASASCHFTLCIVSTTFCAPYASPYASSESHTPCADHTQILESIVVCERKQEIVPIFCNLPVFWSSEPMCLTQAAAGMGIYGPRTIYCIAINGFPGCHEFLLQDDGKWLHVKETTEIGKHTRVHGVEPRIALSWRSALHSLHFTVSASTEAMSS